MRRTVIVLLGVAALVMSCDAPLQKITYENKFAYPVLFYEVIGGGATPRHELAAGDTFVDQVIIPPESDRANKSRRTEAIDAAGALVYCHDFTYTELERNDWRVILEPGHSCSD